MFDNATPPGLQKSLRTIQLGMNWFQSGSGGLDRYYHDLFRALPSADVEPIGLVIGPHDVSAQTEGRIHAFGAPGANMVKRLWSARQTMDRLIRSKNADLVAAHFAMYAAPNLGRFQGKPMVFHFHGPWAAESAVEGAGGLAVMAKRTLERTVLQWAERVLVLSQAFAKVAHEEYGVPMEKIRQVPGSVDVPRFRPTISRDEARERLGWPKDRPILVSVRRLAKRMGLDRLILAMEKIVAAEPDVMLMIAGRGHMAETLQALVKERGLENHVRFLGFVSEADLPLIYRAANYNVIPTASLEGFGLTAAEALASGTPTLVTPVGALPEVVSDLSPDLVFASVEAQAIADRMIAVLKGTIRLPESDACSDYADRRYNAHHAAARVADVYREVV